MRRLAPILALAGLLSSPPSDAHAALYQWVDDAGGTHYTSELESVPGRYRSRVRLLSSDRGGRDAALASQPKPTARPSRVSELVPVESAATATISEPAIRESDALAIAELEGAIQRDREALKDLISQAQWEGPDPTKDPQLRELAQRLARQESDLAALRRSGSP